MEENPKSPNAIIPPPVEQNPIVPPAKPTFSKLNKKYLLLTALVLVFLIPGAILIYQILHTPVSTPPSFMQSLATPTPAPDLTAGWKTYTNKDFNYSFIYPPDYFIDESPEATASSIFIRNIKDKTVPPIATIIIKGYSAAVRSENSTAIQETSDMSFSDYVRKTVLPIYDSSNTNKITFGFSINAENPYTNSNKLSGYQIFTVVKKVMLGKTSFDTAGPLYALDISAYSNQRALFVEPIYQWPDLASNKTKFELTFNNILDSIKFLNGPDQTIGWRQYSPLNYSIKYPPDWSSSEVASTSAVPGNCAYFSDIRNPSDIPNVVSPEGHKIISSCLYNGDMPSTFPYTNGGSDNNTIRSYSLNGYSGIRGQSTSVLGVVDNVLLKNPSGGYIWLQNQIGDSAIFEKALSSFKFK